MLRAMTISSTSRKTSLLVGNGVRTSDPFTFKVQDTDDVAIYRVEDDTESLVSPGTYTVALNPNQNTNPGGTIQWDTAPTADQSYIITTEADATQDTDIQNQGGFNPVVVTETFDKLTILVQQLRDKVGRAALRRSTSIYSQPVLPEPDADKVLALAINPNGDLVGVEQTDIGVAALAAGWAGALAVPFASIGAVYAALYGVSPSNSAAANTLALQACFDAVTDRAQIVLPIGIVQIAGNVTCGDKVVHLSGQGMGVSVLRQTTSGGLVFTGSADKNFDMGRLALTDFTMEAGATGANGTAVTYNYTGGSGYQGNGPRIERIEIVSQDTTQWWTVGIRGTNLRNVRFTGCAFAGVGISGKMTHGIHIDGTGDPVEVWFDDVSFVSMERGILVEGAYEGVYCRGVTTVTVGRSIAHKTTATEPVFRAIDCYFNDRNSSIELSQIAFYAIIGCAFSSTGFGTGDWRSLELNNTSGSPTNASVIANNVWAGGSGGGTETAIHFTKQNAVLVQGNMFYTMDIGVFADANSTGITIGKDNVFVGTPVSYSVVASALSFDPNPLGYAEVDTNGATQDFPVSPAETQVAFSRATANVGGFYDTATRRYLPPIGAHKVSLGAVFTTNIAAGDEVVFILRKNGSTPFRRLTFIAAKAGALGANGDIEFRQTVATDYWDISVVIAGAGGDRTLNGNAANTYATWRPI